MFEVKNQTIPVTLLEILLEFKQIDSKYPTSHSHGNCKDSWLTKYVPDWQNMLFHCEELASGIN